MGIVQLPGLLFTNSIACVSSSTFTFRYKDTSFVDYLRDKCENGSFSNLDDALASFDHMLRLNPLPSIKQFNQLLTALMRMKHYDTVVSLSKKN